MFTVRWRKGVDNSDVYEKVFGPFPVICDYVAGFPIVIETTPMLIPGFVARISESFGENASNLVMPKGARRPADAHGGVVAFCVASVPQAETTLSFDRGYVDTQAPAGRGEPFEGGHVPVFVE